MKKKIVNSNFFFNENKSDTWLVHLTLDRQPHKAKLALPKDSYMPVILMTIAQVVTLHTAYHRMIGSSSTCTYSSTYAS